MVETWGMARVKAAWGGLCLAGLALGAVAACGEDPGAAPAVDGGGAPAVDSGGAPVDAAAPSDAGAADAQAEGGRDAGSGDAAADASSPPGPTCKALLAATPGLPSGPYAVDPDGAGTEPAAQVYCDMTTAGGGWTLGFLRNSVDPGAYPTFGAGTFGLAGLATDPAAASAVAAATPAVAGWIDLNAPTYTELALEGFAGGVSTFRSAPIAKSTLRIAFGQDGYLLHDDANGYFWCGGASTYTDDGQNQVNRPDGAPLDCKGHTSLGGGFDFGGSSPNSNLTMCGGGSRLMRTGPAAGFNSYPSPGGAIAIWVR